MRSRSLFSHFPSTISPLAAGLVLFWLCLGLIILAWVLAGAPNIPVVLGLGGVFAAGLAWMFADRMRLVKQQTSLGNALNARQEHLEQTQAWLDETLQFNRRLLDANEETSLIETALRQMMELAQAAAVTYVPTDEWGQPISVFTVGDLPEGVLKAYAEHLASPAVRERCRTCALKFSPVGSPCPVREGPCQANSAIYCFDLFRAGRLIGVMNVHMPAERKLAPELRTLIEGLLSQLELAVQNVRLRSQEVNTLRQLQLARTSKTDLNVFGEHLLEGLQHGLNADFVSLHVNADSPWQEQLDLSRGRMAAGTEMRDRLVEETLAHHQTTHCKMTIGAGADGGVSCLTGIAVPLKVPDEPVLGALFAGFNGSRDLSEREMAVLSNTADQAALMIANERMVISLEYRMVIQERGRLAREIHDGLAQTLAFLKLQASQMKSYLAQGNQARLSQGMDQHSHSLQEAYLEIRQSIDNLRLTPSGGIVEWISRIADDFQAGSELVVERKLEPPAHEIAPEVQAQLVRIVQEALNNVRKHARANKAWISMYEWNRDLILEIGDDGEGFSSEDVPELSRHGLRGMRERAELIGADFQIVSQPHQGTVVRLRLPNYEETPV